MTAKTIKLIAFIVLLVHGIGHFQGVVASFGVKINNAKPASSWLLKSMSSSANQRISFVLFLITALLGIVTALAFKCILFPENVWQSLAIATAIFSTVCLITFPNSFAMFFNKVGAIVVNLLIYYSVLLNNNWPVAIFKD